MRMRRAQRHLPIIGCLCLAAFFLLQIAGNPPRVFAATAPLSSTNCAPKTQDVTSASLLVVLLDRSGSLSAQPGATDPDGYSTSVTKALADLWPGSMAVIPFGNNRAPVWGPYHLSDLRQRANLKNAIQNYPIGGDTPLAPAMLEALSLLTHAPTGSRLVIVTDGSPDPLVFAGVNQITTIEQTLLPQFCAQGIPVNTFGLTLDLAHADGQLANRLLTEIATGTGGQYVNIANVADLARVVIRLFAQWLHLVFIPAQIHQNTYDIPLDTYANKAIFIAFRSRESFTVTLMGPNTQPLPPQATERFTDRHYEIANLLVSPANQPGVYAINVDGDPGAQVYALVETGLHTALLQPAAQTTLYTDRSFLLEAELLNNTTPVIPKPNEATLNAEVSILVQGQTVSRIIVELVQTSNGALFTRPLTLPGPVGEVHVQINASYLQIPVESSVAQITLPLRSPPAPGPGAACGVTTGCSWLFSPLTTIGGIGVLVLLLFCLLFLLTKKPGGWLLSQGGETRDLGELHRPLTHRIFSRSTLHSGELVRYFDFRDAHFTLLFHHSLHLKIADEECDVKIKRGTRLFNIKDEEGVIEIFDKDAIIVDNCAPAIFHQKKRDEHA